MDIVIDLSALQDVANPLEAAWFLFQNGGWAGFVFAIVYGLWSGWLTYIREKFERKIAWVILAIDVPRANEQTPKAVEQIFAHITGFTNRGTLKERYLEGFVQYRLSLEIVSVEGYIQFLVRTPARFRDLVEAAVYAQYPDAEITEVEDYIDTIPKPLEFPHPEWDLWGTEFKLAKPDVYPIKTYRAFEDPTTEAPLHDPMASLLEILSRMGPGEQCWLQIVITPASPRWAERGVRIIRKLIGSTLDKKQGSRLGEITGGVARGVQETVTATLFTPSAEQKRMIPQREFPTLMQHLAPYERNIVESIGEKIAKLAFVTKFRLIYAARKEVFDRPKGVSSVIGAISQFNTQDLNSFMIHKKARTTVYYMFLKYRKKWRQRRILWGYRARGLTRGWVRFVLNTEELATIWHFPLMTVQAPLVQKTEAKRAAPPAALPIERLIAGAAPRFAPAPTSLKGVPPSTLPVG